MKGKEVKGTTNYQRQELNLGIVGLKGWVKGGGDTKDTNC